MKRKQYEAIMDYYSKLWCLARFADDHAKATWYRQQYEQAECKWQASEGGKGK
jgi:hypothetical protein